MRKTNGKQNGKEKELTSSPMPERVAIGVMGQGGGRGGEINRTLDFAFTETETHSQTLVF